MNRFLKYPFLIFCVFSIALLTHCGEGVTETGNPTAGTQDSDDGGDSGSDDGGDDSSAGDDDTAEEFTCDFCYQESSDTTTADAPSTEADDGTVAEPMVAQEYSEAGTVLFAVCGRVNDCYDSVEADLDCIEGIYQDENVLLAFGVNTTLYTDMEVVQAAIDEGEISVNATRLSTCEEALSGLSCATLTTNTVFDEGSGSYARLYQVIPDDECGNIF